MTLIISCGTRDDIYCTNGTQPFGPFILRNYRILPLSRLASSFLCLCRLSTSRHLLIRFPPLSLAGVLPPLSPPSSFPSSHRLFIMHTARRKGLSNHRSNLLQREYSVRKEPNDRRLRRTLVYKGISATKCRLSCELFFQSPCKSSSSDPMLRKSSERNVEAFNQNQSARLFAVRWTLEASFLLSFEKSQRASKNWILDISRHTRPTTIQSNSSFIWM